jgi:hypothetical protein
MSRFTGKKRKLDYKPILIVGGIAIPVITIVTILAWPRPPVQLAFTEGPRFDRHLTKKGTFLIEWRTNLPTWATVKYRFPPEQDFDEVRTQEDTRGVVPIPAEAGKIVQFLVELPGRRNRTIRSQLYTVELLSPTATRPATASAPRQR